MAEPNRVTSGTADDGAALADGAAPVAASPVAPPGGAAAPPRVPQVEGIRRYRGEKPALRPADLARLGTGEPAALARLRTEGRAAWDEALLPYRGLHLWKYTDPAKLFPSGALVPDLDCRRDVVQVTLPEAARAAGVQALRLAEIAAGGVPAAVAERLGRLVGAEFGLLESLNAAVFTEGVVLYVPRKVVVAEPIHVRVAARDTTAVRLLVVLEEQAGATIVEEHAEGDERAAVLGVTELFAEPAAQLRHVLVQRWADGTRGHQTVRSQLARDAGVQTTLVSVGGAAYKLDIGAVLVGPGARSDIAGVVLADRAQHMDHHTVHDHCAPHAFSNIDLKVVAAGEARSAYTGLIRIAEEAAGSEAYQENRNLVLSSAARAETIPELEILTDEVMCTHGATVAPIEQEHLFYLQSRGIAPREALGLVLDGFFRPTLERLPEALRESVLEDVAHRLSQVTVATALATGSAREGAGS